MTTNADRLLYSGSLLLPICMAGSAQGGAAEQGTARYKPLTVITHNVLHHTDTFIDDLRSLARGTPVPTDRIAPALDLLVS